LVGGFAIHDHLYAEHGAAEYGLEDLFYLVGPVDDLANRAEVQRGGLERSALASVVVEVKVVQAVLDEYCGGGGAQGVLEFDCEVLDQVVHSVDRHVYLRDGADDVGERDDVVERDSADRETADEYTRVVRDSADAAAVRLHPAAELQHPVVLQTGDQVGVEHLVRLVLEVLVLDERHVGDRLRRVLPVDSDEHSLVGRIVEFDFGNAAGDLDHLSHVACEVELADSVPEYLVLALGLIALGAGELPSSQTGAGGDGAHLVAVAPGGHIQCCIRLRVVGLHVELSAVVGLNLPAAGPRCRVEERHRCRLVGDFL